MTHAEAAADDRVQVRIDEHGCGDVRIRANNEAFADDVAGVMPMLGELLEEKLAELGAEDVSVEVGDAVVAASEQAAPASPQVLSATWRYTLSGSGRAACKAHFARCFLNVAGRPAILNVI